MSQSLYSINDVYRQLADPENLREIKIHFIDFLYEVYFETEKRLVDIEGDPWLWKVMAIFCADMEELDKLTAEGESSRSSLLATDVVTLIAVAVFLTSQQRTKACRSQNGPDWWSHRSTCSTTSSSF